MSQIRQHDPVGGKRQRFRWIGGREPAHLCQVIGSAGLTTDGRGVEPHADGEGSRVVKVGMNSAHVADFDFDAGLLLELTACGVANVLAPFDITAGDAPLADVAPGGAFAHQDAPGIIEQHDGDADGRVAEMDEPA